MSWEQIWKKNKYLVNNYPTPNIQSFYDHHLKKLKKKSKILDFWFVAGRNFIFLSDKGFDVYGTDISKSIILKNKKKFPKLKNNFFLGDLKKLKFSSNFFDSIISDGSLYYQTKKQIFETVKKFYELLKKDGILRVYTKSIHDTYYFNHYRKNSFEFTIKKKHWEKGLLVTFLSFKDLKKLFKKFKKVKIGIETFNYISCKRYHSYWVVTAIK